uniref:SCAN box domain-containing protein n=1 Tax=Varanus komodoensis TaxID=61221 RepID=A0A8D2LRG1_VARKO
SAWPQISPFIMYLISYLPIAEAFVAKACHWPREEWASRLAPALHGEAEKAVSKLEAGDREDYGKVKAIILQGEAIKTELQRQLFRQFRYREMENPQRVYGQLQELCRQWLKPERNTKEQILQLLILEQFLAGTGPGDLCPGSGGAAAHGTWGTLLSRVATD